MVSLFLSTALALTTAGCNNQQKVIYDKDGKPIVQQENRSPGFFGGFFAPFGFFGGRSSGISGPQNSVNPGSSTPNNPGVTGVSPWGRGGSTSTPGGTGITGGSHGGVGGGGSSVS